MRQRWGKYVLAAMLTGCASISAHVGTSPPAGRSSAEVARDEAECEAYARSFPRDRLDHYAACMISRWYVTNVSLDELDWTVAVVQTRPHEPAAVTADLALCDRKADNAKNADVVTLTPEQEASIAGQAVSRSAAFVPGLAYQQRPNATRMLVACLHERGYAIRPWVPLTRPQSGSR